VELKLAQRLIVGDEEEDEMATASSNNRRRRSARAGEFFDRARQEATLPRLFAAGFVAAGATAYALLRDPERRERLKLRAQTYVDSAAAWWNDQQRSETPAAAAIPIS
jgi:hypothetical protein